MGGTSNKKPSGSKSSNQGSNTSKKSDKFSDKSKKLSVVITDPNNTSAIKKNEIYNCTIGCKGIKCKNFRSEWIYKKS